MLVLVSVVNDVLLSRLTSMESRPLVMSDEFQLIVTEVDWKMVLFASVIVRVGEIVSKVIKSS